MPPRHSVPLLFGWLILAQLVIGFVRGSLPLLLPELGLPSPTSNQLVERIVLFIHPLISFLLPLYLFPWGVDRQRLFGSSPLGYFSRQRSFQLLLIIVAGFLLSSLAEGGMRQLLPYLGIESRDPAERAILNLMPHSPVGWVWAILTFAVLPAVCEEVFFRGLLQHYLIQLSPQRPWIGIAGSALLFSLLHFSAVGFVSRLGLGLLLGYLAYDSRSLRLPILVHLGNNLLALVLLLGK